jgi:hypothetical protein
MKSREVYMTKAIAEMIVKLCFDTNALEHLCQQDINSAIEMPLHYPADVKHSIDKLISSDSYNSMLRHFEGSKTMIKSMSYFYKNAYNYSEHQKIILTTLDKLYTDVTTLETLITHIQKHK